MEGIFLIQRKEHMGLLHHFLYDANNHKVTVKLSDKIIEFPMYNDEDNLEIKKSIIEYLEKLHYESPTDVLAGNRLQHIANVFRTPITHKGIKFVNIPVKDEKGADNVLLHIIEQESLFKDEKGYKPKYEAVLYNKEKNSLCSTSITNVNIDDRLCLGWLHSLPIMVLISFCFPGDWNEYVFKALKISYPFVKHLDISNATEIKPKRKRKTKTEEAKLEKKWFDLRKWVETVPDFNDKSEKEKISIVNSIMIKKYGKTINADSEDLLF